MSDAQTDLPDDHPLADYNGVLDDHDSHVDALAEYLDTTDADEITSAMVILADEEGAETIPTMHDDADFHNCVWLQLAAHLSHVATASEAAPEDVAKHAVHVLRDQQPPDVHHGEGGETQ